MVPLHGTPTWYPYMVPLHGTVHVHDLEKRYSWLWKYAYLKTTLFDPLGVEGGREGEEDNKYSTNPRPQHTRHELIGEHVVKYHFE